MRALRTALILAALVAVCVAVLQGAGRLAIWQLPRLTPLLNDWLAAEGIVVDGLEGHWDGLNPGFFAAMVEFPGGHVRGLDFELDVLKSLGRNRLIARRLTMADAAVRVVRTPSGWRLPGGGDASDLDIWTFLMHGDQVWLRGRVELENRGSVLPVYGEAMVVNNAAGRRFHFGVQLEPDCAACALTIDGDIPSDVPEGVTQGNAAAIRVAAREFVLHREALEVLGLRGLLAAVAPGSAAPRLVAGLDGRWQRAADGAERAALRLDVDARVAAGPLRLTAELTAWDAGPDVYRGRIDHLAAASGERVFRVASGGFRLVDLPAPGRFVDFWLPAFSGAASLAPIVAALGEEHSAASLLAALNPEAQVRNLVARVDADGVAFHAEASDASMAGRKGIPKVAGIGFTLGGSARAMRLDFSGRGLEIGFPIYLPPQEAHEAGGGTLTFAFTDGYLGMRGEDLRVSSGGGQGTGRIAFARPSDPMEVRVAVAGRVDRLAVAEARAYLPLTLAPTLRQWLLANVGGGELRDVAMTYHGHARGRGALPVRRFEMSLAASGVASDYHPDWPAASNFRGTVEVTALESRIRGDATVFGEEVSDATIRVPRQASPARALVRFRSATSVPRLIDFAWQTPVHSAMPFLSETWTGTGQVAVDAALTVPLDGQELRPGDVRASFHFTEAGIDLTDLGLHFDAVDETLRYEYPAGLESHALEGTLFGEKIEIGIESDAEAVRVALAGSGVPADAYRLLDMADPGIAAGRFDFNATFTVFPASERAMELHVESDLIGVAVDLPPPLGKRPDTALPMTAAIQFLEPFVAVSARYGPAEAWLHTGDGSIRAGAIGIGAPVPMIDAAEGRLVLGGNLDAIDAETMAALLAPEAGMERPFAWELRRFGVGTLHFDALELTDAVLDGYSERGEVYFDVTAQEVRGTVAKSGDQPWQLSLAELQLPAPEQEGDPLSIEAMDRLLAADVVLQSVHVGGEDYGSWRFGVRPQADGVALVDTRAELRGLRIEQRGEVFWARRGETSFAGTVAADNLVDVLPRWDFAPSVESAGFRAAGAVRWPGSPLNFDLAHLSGTADLEVTSGRFLDIAPGAAPIMSLINFSTIAKRMSLDFSDVFGLGVSFEKVQAELAIDDGLARFAKPAEIIGTGSSFLVTGTVDLDSGALENEMIATLPLHSSLPWYAAFLALSNPAGAAAVVVGRQVFKDQLRRLSSGKYRIAGTYDEPEVEFVGMFDDDIALAPGPAADPQMEGEPQ